MSDATKFRYSMDLEHPYRVRTGGVDSLGVDATKSRYSLLRLRVGGHLAKLSFSCPSP
jgi:hypothetical protein